MDSADGVVGEVPDDGGVFSTLAEENLEEMLLSQDPRRDGTGGGGIGAVWPVPLVSDGELVVCGSEGWWW